MNIAVLKSITSSKITCDMIDTKYTQGNSLINCDKEFRDKSCYFDVQVNVNKTKICNFLDLLMYITNDIMISREDYKRFFENNLEKATDFIKTLTHKTRVIQFQIMDVIEDRALLCDYPNCVKFYSNLLKMNITMIVGENTYAKYENNYDKSVIIYYIDGSFDFSINKSVDTTSMKRYLSEKLVAELNVSEMKALANYYSINTKDKLKSQIAEELKHLIKN